MTLTEFSIIVGASAKWTANALQILGRVRDYEFETARILRLVRVLNYELGIGLVEGWERATHILFEPGDRSGWSVSFPGSGVSLDVDRERFHSSLACALSVSRAWYRPAPRGRPVGPRSLEMRLWDASINVTSLLQSVELTPAERLDRLDAAFDLMMGERVPDPSIGEIVGRLDRGRIDCLVHGNTAAALHGALCIPTGLDICPDPAPANLSRLARLLRSVSATLRAVGPGLPFLLDEITLAAEPIVPLDTIHGPVTVYAAIPGVESTEPPYPVSTVDIESGSIDILEIGLLHESMAAQRHSDSIDVATQLEAIMELGLER